MPTPQPAMLKLQGLSIYRQLLRECSYLPPAVRPTIQSQIQKRFHQRRRYDPRAEQHWARARKTLRTLQAANNGHRTCMAELISKAFGRSGARRRELMSDFVVPQGAKDSKELEALTSESDDAENTDAATEGKASKKRTGNKKNLFYLKWDQEKLQRLLRAQKKRVEVTPSASHLLGPQIKFSALNEAPSIWGKPAHEFVVNARKAAWWRRMADKVLPPLGKGEWELLQKLSSGGPEADEWRAPERRMAVGGVQDAEKSTDEEVPDLMRYASQPAAVVERSRGAKRMSRSGQRDTGPYGKTHSGNGLTDRWFRRAYNRTWLLTPKMQQDPRTLKYEFVFGNLPGRQLRDATPQQQSVFEGVDAQGKLVRR